MSALPTVKTKPSPKKTHTLRLTRSFPVGRQKVFDAWTKPDFIRQWYAPGDMTVSIAEVDLRVGGAYRIGMRDPKGNVNVTTGVYQEIVRPERLVFTWGWESAKRAETLVTVTFQAKEGGTLVTLKHDRFASKAACDQHMAGWKGCLANLKLALQSPKKGK